MNNKKENKNIFATNLKRYMALNGKSRRDISAALNVSYYTISDWVNGKKYPRMDKVEMLANYFGCLKSDLIEDKTKMKKNNDIITDIIVRMRSDADFLSLVDSMMQLDSDQVQSVKQLMDTFLKQHKN